MGWLLAALWAYLMIHGPLLKPWTGFRRPPHKRDAKWFT